MLFPFFRRIAAACITLILASFMVFGALQLIPGDPVQLIIGLQNDPALYETTKNSLGLDKPPMERYVSWFSGVLRGDLGASIAYNKPVLSLILERLPITVPLILASSLLSLSLALLFGIWAARAQGRPIDMFIGLTSSVGLAVPSFWSGLILILIFSVTLHWLPSGGFVSWSENPHASLRSLILPVLTLSLGLTALLTRIVRVSVLEVQAENFVRTARSKGVREHMVFAKHILRNAALPILTVFGVQFGQLLVGTIVVETVFSLPSLGTLALRAADAHDFPLVQGVTMVIAGVIIAVNLIVDLLYSALDPRIRYE